MRTRRIQAERYFAASLVGYEEADRDWRTNQHIEVFNPAESVDTHKDVRALLWAEQFWPLVGGAELFAARLVLALRDRGWEFEVVTRQDAPDLPALDSYMGIPVHRFPFWTSTTGGKPEDLLAVRAQVTELKQSFLPDIVHLNGFTPTTAFFHDLTNQNDRSPYLITLHGMLDHRHSAAESLLRRTLGRADQVVGCSEATMHRAVQLIPAIAGHSSVIRHGLPTPTLLPAPLPTDAPKIVCLGRLDPLKGFDLALAAFARLAHRFPDARLIIAGDGEERPALEQQAADLCLNTSVTFTGWVAPDEVPALLNRATLVAVPSRDEAFGLVALEAALMARPVISASVGGLPEIVEHNKTGLLVSEGDSEALAAAMETLLTQPHIAEAMGMAARDRAVAEFSWQANVDAYDKLYRQIVTQTIGARQDEHEN